MELENLYSNISSDGINKIFHKEESIDYWLNNIDKDTRMGIAVLARPNDNIKYKIQGVENELKKIEENQYYYPKDNLHTTLFSIIVSKENFKYTQNQIEMYNEIINKILKEIKKFKINFKGIIASDGAVIVKGYYKEELEYFRRKLKKEILEHGLELNEKYITNSSHITISRFKESLKNREKFIKFIEEHNNYDFGEVDVSEIELTYHSMYGGKKEILYKYMLE